MGQGAHYELTNIILFFEIYNGMGTLVFREVGSHEKSQSPRNFWVLRVSDFISLGPFQKLQLPFIFSGSVQNLYNLILPLH